MGIFHRSVHLICGAALSVFLAVAPVLADDKLLEGLIVDKAKRISVENDCHKSIKFSMRWKSKSGPWYTNYWWEFDPYEEFYLSSDGHTVTFKHNVIYFYAESYDSKWSGDHNFEISNSRILGMRRQELYPDLDYWKLRLSCDD